MQWFYALYNLAIFGGPLIGCWLWFRGFWQVRYRMVLAWCTVSVVWIALDAFSVARGWWDYNPQYITGLRVFGLPIEEIAFFFTVPLACMITFYALSRAVRGTVGLVPARRLVLIIAAGLVLFAASQWGRERTGCDVALALVTLAILYRSTLLTSRTFWAWNGVLLLLFVLFNTILTALPVVVYDEQFMTGIRIGTIPLEDFLYNFSLLNMVALVVRPDRS
jgi:lycopene cyclase domain-containing protein